MEQWTECYEREVEHLTTLFQDHLLAMHHIGSTAIRDMYAVPIIDVLVFVDDFAAIELLKELGYYSLSENCFSDRCSSVHVYCYVEGDKEGLRHLTIRNYLIAHPEEAHDFGLLKKGWIESGEDYELAKQSAFPILEKKALEFKEKGPYSNTTFPLPIVNRKMCFLNNLIKGPNIDIGDYTYYHDHDGAEDFEKKNVLYHEPVLGDRLIIGKFCQIAMGTRFMMNASFHQMNGFSTFPFAVYNENWAKSYDVNFPMRGDTVIGNDVWFGYQAFIMPGIKIGNGAIIAAHAVVTKDVPPYTIVGGNPAKIIRQRFDDKTIEELEQIAWWDWPIEKILEHLPEITGNNIEKLRKIARI